MAHLYLRRFSMALLLLASFIGANAYATEQGNGDVLNTVLHGSWTAARIVDPEAAKPAEANTVSSALIDAGLPALGTVVETANCKLCMDGRPCLPFGWTATTLSKVDGGPSLMRQFNLTAQQRVYVGSDGGKRSYILLVPQDGRDLGAAFNICDTEQGDNCRTALQIWQPLNAEAKLSPIKPTKQDCD